MADIEHVVILIQENRSFDHYFGTYRACAASATTAAPQRLPPDGRRRQDAASVPLSTDADCLPDLTHDWGPQHLLVEQRPDGRLPRGARDLRPASTASAPGRETMGYYTRADLPFYYALADAFTICDGYHCSVIGPTDPNRLMSMSASIDPAGTRRPAGRDAT